MKIFLIISVLSSVLFSMNAVACPKDANGKMACEEKGKSCEGKESCEKECDCKKNKKDKKAQDAAPATDSESHGSH